MHGENIVDLIADPSELATNGGNIIRPQFEAGRRQQVPETEGTGRDACDALTEAAPRGRTSASDAGSGLVARGGFGSFAQAFSTHFSGGG